MRTYLTRKEHEEAGDYSGPVLIRGRYYRVLEPPIFEDLRDTASVEATLLSDPATDVAEQAARRDA
ncbi:MAG: hypothetical protein JWQ82_5 [Tardiphaga sp.]|nr:hypothetical protein [Tardiphaga sp.]